MINAPTLHASIDSMLRHGCTCSPTVALHDVIERPTRAEVRREGGFPAIGRGGAA